VFEWEGQKPGIFVRGGARSIREFQASCVPGTGQNVDFASIVGHLLVHRWAFVDALLRFVFSYWRLQSINVRGPWNVGRCAGHGGLGTECDKAGTWMGEGWPWRRGNQWAAMRVFRQRGHERTGIELGYRLSAIGCQPVRIQHPAASIDHPAAKQILRANSPTIFGGLQNGAVATNWGLTVNGGQ
jgi:hypothetical protein